MSLLGSDKNNFIISKFGFNNSNSIQNAGYKKNSAFFKTYKKGNWNKNQFQKRLNKIVIWYFFTSELLKSLVVVSFIQVRTDIRSLRF